MLKKIITVIAISLSISNSYSLTTTEKNTIRKKLSQLPITLTNIEEFIFSKKYFSSNFQNEIESLLKLSLIESDTKVLELTYPIRVVLNLDRNVAGFHKQLNLPFKITLSREGSFQGEKQNEGIRKLESNFFTHPHNVFLKDAPISYDENSFSLLIHELGHAAFDSILVNHYQDFKNLLLDSIPSSIYQNFILEENGELAFIDGDFYDWLSERYSFEMEYRLNREITRSIPNFPFNFSYTETPIANFPEVIEDYVKRHYDLDHPLLNQIPLIFLNPIF